MKTALIIGGSYFIGKRIVSRLNDEYAVTVLNRGSKSPDNEKTQQLVCDRNDPAAVKKVLENKHFDVIVDVCGLNASHCEILCGAIAENPPEKFIFISSSAVYAVEELTAPYSENDKKCENRYWKDYGTGKTEAENYLIRFFSDKETALTILRPPYVYGEYNYVQRESFVFEHILSRKPILIPKSDPRLQFIYSGDLAETVAFFLGKNGGGINIFNVGNRAAVTSSEWINTCAAAIGKPAEIISYDYLKNKENVRDFFPFYDYDNVLDVSQIKEMFPAETDFEAGLTAAYRWFLGERESIVFKSNVAENEKRILAEIKA